MNRKRIGIVGWNVGENSFGVTKSYLEYFENFGNVEVIHPSQPILELDLLVMPGGADVDPVRYGERPSLYTGNPNVILEYFDRVKLPEYIRNGTNIFGICRGMQSLAVHFGAKLIQEIGGGHPYSTKHRGQLVHKVYIYDDSVPLKLPGYLYDKKAQKNYFETNSLHHQAVDLDSIGKDSPIQVTGLAKDSHVEIIKIQGHNIIAVQYHPEETICPLSNHYIKTLLNSNVNVSA